MVDTLNGQVATLQTQENEIASAQTSILFIQNSTIPSMLNQLTGFNNIWNSVASDCGSSISFINDTMNGNAAVEVYIYSLLAFALL